MVSLAIYSWIILTLILLMYPLGYLVWYFFKGVNRGRKKAVHKYEEIKALDQMKKDLFKKNIAENKEYNFFEEEKSDTPKETLKNKEDTVDKIFLDKQNKMLEKIKYEGLVQKERGNLELYEKKLIEGLAIDNNNLEFLKMLGELYFTMGNHKKTLGILKRVLEQQPDDHKTIWQIGEIYLEKGQFDTAELLIEKALSFSPNNPKYFVSLVEIKYNKDQKEQAVNLMEKVIKLRPTNLSYLSAIATLYEELGDINLAKKYYFKMLEIEPTNDEAKNKLKLLK